MVRQFVSKGYTWTIANGSSEDGLFPAEKGCNLKNSHNTSMLLRSILVACAISLVCVSTVSCLVWAEPSSQEVAQKREGLEAELREAQERLDQLQGEIDETSQELEECKNELDATNKEADEMKAQVEESGQRLAEKRNELGMIMRDNYKMGLFNTFDFLLGSTSFEDFVGRIYYLDKIGEARAEQIQEVNKLAEELSAREQELRKIKDHLQTNVDDLEAKTLEYDKMFYSIQEYRDGLDEDVQKALEEEEAARQAEEEAKRKAEEEASRKTEEPSANVETPVNKENTGTGSTPAPEQNTTVSYVHQASPGDADRLIYIQWGARPQVCWPVKGASNSMKVDCGCMTLMHATILLTGDFSLTPDKLFAAMEAKYGSISSSQAYNTILRYIKEVYGINHRNVGHLSASQARGILAAGHVISAGGGCEGRDGLPFCKAVGVRPRCCHGHVVLFYKYADGIFWAKDSAPGDGAAMCAYPDGPLTVTHQGAVDGRCSHNGQTASYNNYADAFLRNSWNVELWK